jgi:subtilisin family serine protease
MRIYRAALYLVSGVVLLALCGIAVAQKYDGRDERTATGKDTTRNDTRSQGGGGPGIISVIPRLVPPPSERVEKKSAREPVRKQPPPPRSTARRSPSGVPPANERRLVPDEVVVELSAAATPQDIQALQGRHQLTLLESQSSLLSGTTLLRWRIPDRRTVAAVVAELEGDAAVQSAQPNYLYSLQQAGVNVGPVQYEIAKLRLREAHALAKGHGIVVAVVDSGVDAGHPDLAGSIAGAFDAITVKLAGPLNKHGTSIAGLIAAHGTLLGSAPAARILAVKVFGPTGNGNTFDVLKGLDYAAANGARIINMSFTGPSDPITLRSLQASYKRGIILIAAAGNAGPKSPLLYPSAYPEVIAVSGSDVNNKSSVFSNRGTHISVAAPGTDILVAIPDGGFEVGSGTSFSAAEVTGIVAMMLERNGDLSPDTVRRILESTAKDIGPKGRDVMFGAGLVDAFGAVTAADAPSLASGLPIERVSTGVR